MNKLFFVAAVFAACTAVSYADPQPQAGDQTPELRPTLPLINKPAVAPPPGTSSENAGASTFTESTTTIKSDPRAGFMDFLEGSTAPSLHGVANLTDITATARSLSLCPLSRSHNPDLKYVEVTVKNDGQNIAVILGNAARADVSGTRAIPAPASVVEESDRPRLNTKGRVVVGAAALGSWGLAGPLVYEYLTPDQHRRRSLGTPIGRDGSRFEVEATHFGIRVIMPGDQAVGWFAFSCPPESSVKSLVIPVSYTRSTVPTGTIMVPVAQTASN
jgi:hypothetical protein